MDGATLPANRSYRFSLLLNCWNSSSSSGENARDPGDDDKEESSSIPKTRRYGCLSAGAPELFFCAASARQGWSSKNAYAFGRGESRVDTGGDDPRSWDNLSGEETVGVQLDPRTQCCLHSPLSVHHHMPGQLSDGNHVGCFLELDCLLVTERRPVM